MLRIPNQKLEPLKFLVMAWDQWPCSISANETILSNFSFWLWCWFSWLRLKHFCVYTCHRKNLSQPPKDSWRRHQIMWFNMANKKLSFPNLTNITPFKIGLTYTEFVNTWETVKFRIALGLFSPLGSFRRMGNRNV